MEKSAPRPLRILVTGFGAFPGAPFNPTQAIVGRLGKFSRRRLERLGIDLHVAVLPVTYSHSDDELPKLLDAIRPDAVLHLGLAARRRTITVETRGLNRISILRRDAAKRVARQCEIEVRAPFSRSVNLPVAGMMSAIVDTGLPAGASSNAGDYVCNHTLYVSLAEGYRAGFIHVPRSLARFRPTRGQFPGRPDIAAMTRAIEATLVTLKAKLT